ncbi:receptor-like protein 7 [Quercus robur]|uniref:receptor-like protein 7 n=1 Tax=Quercus robur TaxID=38942 RepID=UPI002161C1A7|nr:receptor-like protein 7 [Quercus robur]
MQPLCLGHERSYLLQFKESFVNKKSASSEPWAYPKVASWTSEGNNNDCCSWDGVECDEFTGHVIGLDLNSSCLYGSINSSSSLFHLVHLQRLNLADNHFKYSQIPSTVSNLSKLTHLDLSSSAFASQIPLEVSQLSQLSSLNLSGNAYLELKKPSLRSLIENLTFLEKLDLREVEIISMVPNILANLSFLTSLRLRDCRLYGEFPVGIFKLPNLRVLDMQQNEGLTGHLPDFQSSSTLEIMNLAKTNFSGKLPASIGNLGSLTTILIWGCNFYGLIPSSLGNLTRLNSLDLSYNTYKGRIPSSFGNLAQLSSLYLTSNEFTSPIPSVLANLTQLTALNLGDNKFVGQIPSSIFNLTNLEFLSLSDNYFSGTVEFDKFVKLKKLTTLYLSNNQISLLESEASANRTHQKFVGIGLSRCNLSKFPNFLANQNELELLNLQGNNIHGQVPEWVWNMSKESLKSINLFDNFLTGLGQHPILLPWTNLAILDLSSNNIQGSLPIPSPSTLQYHASHNSFIGNISELICNLSSLQVLELSENNLSGPLPQCLHSFGDSLVVLDIRRNKFEGSIPQTWAC